jgi:hypothetical protein
MSNLAKILGLPTEIKDSYINETTTVHPNFKNYDHSLEKVRVRFKLIEDGGEDGIEMGDLTSRDILG